MRLPFILFALLSLNSYAGIELVVSSHFGAGFFCELGRIVTSIISNADMGIVKVSPDWTHEFFPYKDKPHENGWDLFFESITHNGNIDSVIRIQEVNSHNLHDQTCTAPWVLYNQYFPYFNYVHNIIADHFRVKKHILDQVESYYNKNLKHSPCIGVHVRFARIHDREIPGRAAPTLEHYFAEIDHLTKITSKQAKIYLATDSHFVIDQFKKRYGKNVLYIDAFRASYRQDPHLICENPVYWLNNPKAWHEKKPGYKGGLTALLDCLILSKCDYLIHTTSNLSSFVCFFNPHIKSIYLPKGLKACCSIGTNSTVKNPYLNPY